MFHDYTIGRSSPVWKVPDAALRARQTNRLYMLAQPKKIHPDYKPCRATQTLVSAAARKAVASSRLEDLAVPKNRPEIEGREWSVKHSALVVGSSERVTELAHAKTTPLGFMPDKVEVWKVSKGATKARPSKRIGDLAKPVIREIATNLPNPDAFIVKKSAQKAKCSERLAELSQPVLRGDKSVKSS